MLTYLKPQNHSSDGYKHLLLITEYTCQNTILTMYRTTQFFAPIPVSAQPCIVFCQSDHSCLLLLDQESFAMNDESYELLAMWEIYCTSGKTSKAVYRCKSIYRSTDMQKWWHEKPPDREEAGKVWDCHDFIHHVKVSPWAKLNIYIHLG